MERKAPEDYSNDKQERTKHGKKVSTSKSVYQMELSEDKKALERFWKSLKRGDFARKKKSNNSKQVRVKSDSSSADIPKLTVVFDLDSTLIYSTAEKEFPGQRRLPSMMVNMQNLSFKITKIPNYFQLYTAIRPYCDTVLKNLRPLCNIMVFSLGNAQYVQEVLTLIDPNREYFDTCEVNCVPLSETMISGSPWMLKICRKDDITVQMVCLPQSISFILANFRYMPHFLTCSAASVSETTLRSNVCASTDLAYPQTSQLCYATASADRASSKADSKYYVAIRPHCRTLLETIRPFCNIMVYSAGARKYVNHIDSTLVYSSKEKLFPAQQCLAEKVNVQILFFKTGKTPNCYFQYFTAIRPHCIMLLKNIRPLCNIMMFSLGTESYVNDVLTLIDPNGEYFE
ncbi:RNA polymerase II C-terminal domain phosphatase-like 4 [Trichinella zimbabwensis]|uniref:Mitochondrial import inner membrane translocase subunit TIM50 n=1 Tax=Trichinella zimbabwensis TaxID=268475 RepID=A0A0V1HSB1_9BILA|nr:RNA polymerase II C-terminal domain phosphatase-like 4 [Trichinella zimbabwensis]